MKQLKHLIYIFFFISLFQSCQCSVVTYADINEYQGCKILRMETDSVGTIETTIMYIQTTPLYNQPPDILKTHWKYKEITVEPEMANLFKVNDTI